MCAPLNQFFSVAVSFVLCAQSATDFISLHGRQADESAMRWFFSSFGWCEDFKIVYDSTSGASKGFVLTLNGSILPAWK
jgi:hypothetical protein